MRLVGGGSEADQREGRLENATEEWSSVLDKPAFGLG